ncbi:MAG: hypothetical protein D6681_01570 [Calditrichaeota bacterium]|nr:MAG: hypothetical protein D6681_01570 [Calditrichota bacterium]
MNRRSTRHTILGLILFGIAGMLPPGGTTAQAQTRTLYLARVEVHFREPVDFPEKELQREYRNRIYTRELSRKIGAAVLEQLKMRGYYFAGVDSQSVSIDSALGRVELRLWVRPGRRLRLNRVSFAGDDSLSPELRAAIREPAPGYLGRVYTPQLAEGLFREVIGVLENNGYPLARVSTGEFRLIDTTDADLLLNLTLKVSPGDSVTLAYLSFPKQKSNLTGYLQRVLRFHPGQRYEERRVSRYVRILRRQEFIQEVKEPVLSVDKQGQYFLSIEFQEAPATTFDGVIGYIPPPANDPQAKGFFTGLINIGVRNLFGGGRKFTVFWQKQDRFSEEFRLAYREPFVLGLPFHAGIGLYRLVRDTTFIEWRYNLNLQLPINENLTAYVDFASRNVVPDSLASRVLRLPQTERLTTETGLRWDTRDDLVNPRAGLLLEMAFSLGSQKNLGPTFLIREDSLRPSVTIRRARLDFSTFVPTFGHQLLANHLHLEFVESSGEELRLTDQVWFGGSQTVRGFRESQFFGKRVAWVNTEYRFLLGPKTRFFVFTDNAYFTRNSPDRVEKFLTSYGLGVRFPGPVGIIQADVGLEKGAPFREAKLHFRVINEF